ncbi:MAG: class IV adenylate cyclase [Bacteroidia bacterium]|nr:class IV adenylate cyclase [Bacteroidia bacterium]
MARNIEIKARLDNAEDFLSRVGELADSGPFEMEQDDTFFRCENGRLKLRVLSEAHAELIYYRRGDQAGPKESYYHITPTMDPEGLRESLDMAYGIVGRVVKHRTLFMIGRTRVHIDRVEGLGSFMELEVVLNDDERSGDGMREATTLMHSLGIAEDSLIDCAYVDML